MLKKVLIIILFIITSPLLIVISLFVNVYRDWKEGWRGVELVRKASETEGIELYVKELPNSCLECQLCFNVDVFFGCSAVKISEESAERMLHWFNERDALKRNEYCPLKLISEV